MRIKLLVLLTGLFAVLLLAACAGGAQSTAEPPIPAPTQPTAGSVQPTTDPATTGPIRIGGGFALTGKESALDLPAANGAKLAIKEINSAGGINGRTIDFVVHDTQYKMDVTAQVCNRPSRHRAHQRARKLLERKPIPSMLSRYIETRD